MSPMGPKTPKSTVLTPAEEAIVVAFRQKTLLPLDDVPGCLKDTIPYLSRSALHRCLQRHGISRPPVKEAAEKRKRFKTYEIGYVHNAVEVFPYEIHTVFTDNGMAFADLPKYRDSQAHGSLGGYIVEFRPKLSHLAG